MIKGLLIALNTKNMIYDISYTIDEMKNLCLSSNIEIISSIVQTIDRPNNKYYTGSGKIAEIKSFIEQNEIDCVVYDDELTPSQLKNISEYLGDIDIYDRCQIILNIFSQRANSNEAILQVKLAKARYDLPRIGLLQKNISREGASGSGLHSKGSGETQTELSRRLLAQKISKYIAELKEIKKRKALLSAKRTRNAIPIVALVGYTNAGKSSTMNKIIEYSGGDKEKCVYAENQLFATLDTRVRQIEYKNNKFLLIDTVGFVSKLPYSLFEAFRSTFEEIKNADLIIHVVDFSSKYLNEQYQITLDMLQSVDAIGTKQLLLLNKYDLLENQNMIVDGIECLPYSNYSNLNVDALLDYINENTAGYVINLKLNIPYKEQKLCHIIEENATINSKLYLTEYIYYDISINKSYYKMLSLYEANENIN